MRTHRGPADGAGPEADQPSSAQLAAGLVIFARTATPELGITPTTESALTGVTENPWKAG